jgi:hypothetical protein
MQAWLPDAELVGRLESVRGELADASKAQVESANKRLRTAVSDPPVMLKKQMAKLQQEIKAREDRRRERYQQVIALLTGDGVRVKADIQNEIDISLLTAELEALRKIENLQATFETSRLSAEAKVARDKQHWSAKCADFEKATHALRRMESDFSFLIHVPFSEVQRVYQDLSRSHEILGQQCRVARSHYDQAMKRLAIIKQRGKGEAVLIDSSEAAALTSLDQVITQKRAELDSARNRAEKVQRSIRNVFGKALAILIGVTLAPIGIKAFWYWVLAPAASRQPPIRLRPGAGDGKEEVTAAWGDALSRQKASAVSQELTPGPHEELLVHPDFLQSVSDRGRKNTKWLLDGRYPLTSLAARLVALTRIRAGTGESFIISSRNDPFAEVGLIELSEGDAMVLQPRSLVGVVQNVGHPIRIERKWQFRLSAWITFQFRYLIFEGPGTLIVQGCRGVRIERSGSGRSIDQAATIGFSANLDYSARRSEPFGAYLMGENSLFYDNFTGEPGVYVYEEMPYAGKKSGITGRGLEGLTDGLLKVFGI